ncbi:MAG TPA: LLM class flavin-dependent oxidoreductase [Actinomycetota bacterium]|nr:LLM class flavin-dependent oxidoreductase [Actinomycetota bacterium]
MKVGVVLPLFSGDPGKVLDAAREAEELRFDGAFVFDHFFPPGAPRDRPALEAFTTLAAVAAATERIAVGTLVTRVSLRPAGMLAKLGAWLDAASGGRLILGLGTGDPIDRLEHEAYGIPMPGREERRVQLEETVVAVKALWRGEPYRGGRFVPPLEGPVLPPPARAGGPPVWLGAQADAVVRIAGRWADGWNGWGLNPDDFRGKAAVLSQEAEDASRSAEPTWAGIALVGTDEAETRELAERRRARGLDDQAWTGTAEEFTAFLRGLAEAGATWAVIVPAGPADRRQLIAKEVLPALAQRA